MGPRRKCSRCKVPKLREDFGRNAARADGFNNECRPCSAERAAEWYKNNKPRAAERNAGWKQKNLVKVQRANRNWSYFRKYGLSLEGYEAMLLGQGGVCANEACKATEPGGIGSFHVDHAHVPGFDKLSPELKRTYVRGLLCNSCNLGLGYFRDSAPLLAGAIRYLEQRT